MIKQALKESLSQLVKKNTLYVAYSGGLDSSVLLHGIYKLRNELDVELKAVHINHQLNLKANEWQSFCKKQCDELDIPLICVQRKVKNIDKQSIEETARNIRRDVFTALMKESGIYVLTAHHHDDQIETFLLRLMSGAGIKGLSSMKHLSSLGKSHIIRPFLNIPRDLLEEYARANQLEWIEDDSNQDVKFDRNYIRNQLLPQIKQRWPGVQKTLGRSIQYIQETDLYLSKKIESCFQKIFCESSKTLELNELQKLSDEELAWVLRFWLEQLGVIMPSSAVLGHIIKDVVQSKADAQALVAWEKVEVRKYQNRLYCKPRNAKERFKSPVSLNTEILESELSRILPIESQNIKTSMSWLKAQEKPVHLSWRKGGETCRPWTRQGSCSLKKLLQESRIPPWQRDEVPLLYLGEQIVEVIGVTRCRYQEVKLTKHD